MTTTFFVRRISVKGVFYIFTLMIGVFALSGCYSNAGIGILSPSPDLDARAVAVANTYAPVPDKAVVYVYTELNGTFGLAWNTAIYFNGVHVATINQPFFARVVIPGGRYVVRTEPTNEAAGGWQTPLPKELIATESFDFSTNHVYYILTGKVTGKGREKRSTLLLMSPEEAKREIMYKKLVNDYWIQ